MPDTAIHSSFAPRHRPGAYDNPFAPDNVYGHAVALLSRHRGKAEGALHIDIGSGFGRIAEPLVAELGLTYLACDLDDDALGSLAERGFETRRLVLESEERVYQGLAELIGGRRLASISIIDTLEHLDDPAATLRALARIAAEYQAFVLISVPNIAHRDLGLRLLFGLWDYTETGILDHTHRVLFSDSVLRRMLAASGLHIVDANDVKIHRSDQAFPADHPALQSGTALHRLLSELRDLGDPFGGVNQLVRLCAAGPVACAPPFEAVTPIDRPFLSVVIRSAGRQPDLLAALLTCLAAQTVTDFEVLILGHGLDRPRQVGVEEVILDLPIWLRAKIRFLRVDHGNRTALLNDGFAAAAGHYICVLDEEDVVFADWAERFWVAAEAAPGRILRADAAALSIRRVEYNFATGVRAETGPQKMTPSGFDFFEHLRADASALPAIAFPRGLFHHLRICFDPELDVGAGWDVLLRGAALVGVTSVPAVTAIQQAWGRPSGEAAERRKVMEKFSKVAAPLWPAACICRLCEHLDALDRLREEAASDRRALADLRKDMHCKAELAALSAEKLAHRRALQDVAAIYGSRSWQVTAPLRLLRRLAGRRPMNEAAAGLLSTAQLRDLEAALRASRSWRFTAGLRRLTQGSAFMSR
jgi:2-polyprenyl-3-methyl-5-hydroxy-6-metoxy-1,4-benzoquinol methylase